MFLTKGVIAKCTRNVFFTTIIVGFTLGFISSKFSYRGVSFISISARVNLTLPPPKIENDINIFDLIGNGCLPLDSLFNAGLPSKMKQLKTLCKKNVNLSSCSPITKDMYEALEQDHCHFEKPLICNVSVTTDSLSCQLKRMLTINVNHTFWRGTGILQKLNLANSFPSISFVDALNARKYKSCALVMGSPEMRDYKLGAFIDSHDAVARMNMAPISGYEEYVGNRTTINIINALYYNKIEHKPEPHNLLTYIWFTGKTEGSFTSTLVNDYKVRNGHLIYKSYQNFKNCVKNTYLSDGIFGRRASCFIKKYFNDKAGNIASSGFQGFLILMHICDEIDVFGVSNLTGRVGHYYKTNKKNSSINNDAMHPYKTERMLYHTLAINKDSKDKGFLRIHGFSKVKQCL